MALEDFKYGSMTGANIGKYYWYKNAKGKMTTYATDTDTDFGRGYLNTKNMIAKWNASGTSEGYLESSQDDYDIWKHIQNEHKRGWYIPSRQEWSAFNYYLSTRTNDIVVFGRNGNYKNKYNLEVSYWSSSLYYPHSAWVSVSGSGRMDECNVDIANYVRLGITF